MDKVNEEFKNRIKEGYEEGSVGAANRGRHLEKEYFVDQGHRRSKTG
jgi:hypothetical protein